MPVNISKLWGNDKFISLTNNAKLLYVYIITHPSINSVGVLPLNLEITTVHLKTKLSFLREWSKEIVDEGYIHIKKVNDVLYFIAPAHFNTLSKSDSTIIRVNNDLRDLPDEITEFLYSIGINSTSKIKKFIKPTQGQVLEYSLSKGYRVDPNQFIDFYEKESARRGKTEYWVNSKGKVVRDWKATLRNVWFKDENKFIAVKGSPKGYEFFNVEIDGKVYYPDFWKDGLPKSKNFLISKELKKQYEIKQRSEDSK